LNPTGLPDRSFGFWLSVPAFSEKPNEPLDKPAGLMDRFISAVDICVDTAGLACRIRGKHFGGDEREVSTNLLYLECPAAPTSFDGLLSLLAQPKTLK
jgi:hypothetical protein